MAWVSAQNASTDFFCESSTCSLSGTDQLKDTSMPQYKVLGFDRITGQNVGISVEAPSRDEAVKDSRAKTMLIWKVIEIPNESDEVPEPMWEAPPPVSERSPQPYDGILSNATTLDTIGGVIQLLGVLAFIGGV